MVSEFVAVAALCSLVCLASIYIHVHVSIKFAQGVFSFSSEVLTEVLAV